MRSPVKSGGVEDYLATIYRLTEVYGCAKTTMISRELGVTPATTSKVARYLEHKGLVRRARYREVALTENGLKLAKHVIRKHRIAEVFLRSFLGADLLHAHIYAHILEHLPDDLIDMIYVRLGSPISCPHGNVIDTSSRCASAYEIRLNDVDVGSEVTIVRIAGELAYSLRVLSQLGLDIGSKIKVVGKCATLLLIEIPGKGAYEVPGEVAKTVVVKYGG